MITVSAKSPEEEIKVHLVTTQDDTRGEQQDQYLENIKNSTAANGIDFTWDYDTTGTIHARHIITDTGWKISLDRGLDIFQRYEMNDSFSLNNRVQETRACKAFEVTFIKI